MSTRLTEIRGRLAELKPEIEALGTAETLTDDEARSLDEKITEFDTLTAESAPLEARAAKVEQVRSTVIPQGKVDEARVSPAFISKPSPFDVLESRGQSPVQYRKALVDGLLRANESLIEANADQAHFEQIVKRHSTDTRWAENILGRSRPEYASAWGKLMRGDGHLLSEEERTAMSIGTAANGGSLVPTHLDPSLILTNSGSSNVIRSISRVVTLTDGNVWNGVTTAGVTASWDGELVEVSDDTPTVGTASITCYKAQAFVQASIEAFEDIAGLSSDLMMLFADARDRLEGAAHATGSGSAPQGIFTALDANTNVEVTSTTAATIGLVDLHGLYAAVPVRHRSNASWLMNPVYSLAIKALGTAVSASYSNDITQSVAGSLLGRPLIESDDAPTTQTTTVRDNEIVVGNFQNYVIVDKPGGTSIEFIPHLFNTTSNLPDGRRGYYMHWRNGADSVNDVAFRLLQDKTSA